MACAAVRVRLGVPPSPSAVARTSSAIPPGAAATRSTAVAVPNVATSRPNDDRTHAFCLVEHDPGIPLVRADACRLALGRHASNGTGVVASARPGTAHAQHQPALARARRSTGARNRAASSRCSERTAGAPSRSAIVRATRSSRSVPRPDSPSRSARRIALDVVAGDMAQVTRSRAPRTRALGVRSVPQPLRGPGCRDPDRDGPRCLRRRACDEGRRWHAVDDDPQVDAITQRAGHPAEVALRHARRAGARPIRRSELPAGARVHRRHEREPRRKRLGPPDAHDRHAPLLQRLAERLEHVAAELRQLVAEENALVRQRHLARGHVADRRPPSRRTTSCGGEPGTAAGGRARTRARARRPTRRRSPRAPRRRRDPGGARGSSGRGGSSRRPAGRGGASRGRPRGRSRARAGRPPAHGRPRGPRETRRPHRPGPARRVIPRPPVRSPSRAAAAPAAAVSSGVPGRPPPPRRRSPRAAARSRGRGAPPPSASSGTTTLVTPRAPSARHMGRIPGTRRTSPPRPSSPTRASRPGPARSCSEPSRIPTAIARSSEAPALRSSAGARLTVIRRGGWW